MTSKMYRINFGTGKMEPIDESAGDKNSLPVGTILHLNGYDCPDYVITLNKGIDSNWPGYGACYECINLQSGERQGNHASSMDWLKDKKDNRIQMYITDKIMTPAEMETALNRAAIIKTNNDKEAKEAADAKAKERADLPAMFPHLLIQDEGTNSRILATKNIKRELKREFPSILFSIKSKVFSCGDSIDISWTDGPTSEQVDNITDKYEEGHFDGMTDSYEYSRSNWTEVFGGAKYVMTNRHISGAHIVKVAAECGFSLTGWDSDSYGKLPGLDDEKSQIVYRAARTQAA